MIVPTRAWPLVAAVALGAAASGAEPTPVKPQQEWSGSVDAEALEKIAPPVVTTAEGWSILWKAWGQKGDPPAVDFDEDFVAVTTTRGSKLNVTFRVDDKGDLTVGGLASRDLRPGFRFHLAVLPRSGVATVAGKPLAGGPPDTPAPAPTARPYRPEEPVEGALKVVGSLTMSHVATLWAEEFGQFHPDLKIDIDSEGSETGLPEVNGGAKEVVMAAVSRPLSSSELAAWEKKGKVRLLVFPVCEDDIALVVHRDNPVKALTPEHLKLVLGAAAGERPKWGDLGVTDKAWAEKPVTLYGRDDSSGTRQFLAARFLGPDGKPGPAKEYESDRAEAKAVAADEGGIGYVRDAYVTDAVKAVPLSAGGRPVPLRRTCSLVVVSPDGKTVPPAAREFLTYVYRLGGQTQLQRDNFTPLGREVVAEQLQRLGVKDIK